MPSIDLFALMGIILVLVLLGILFLIPTTKRPGRRKRKIPFPLQEDHKNWKAVGLKLEKYIHSLRKDIADLQKRDRLKERDLVREREKNKRAQNKLAQERGWHDKEQRDVEKKTLEVRRVRQEMGKLEHDLGSEHSSRLKLERELKKSREDFAAVDEQKRKLDSEAMKQKAKAEQNRLEIRELKAANAELSKKHADTTWIAKTEYTRVERELKKAEKELEKLQKSS